MRSTLVMMVALLLGSLSTLRGADPPPAVAPVQPVPWEDDHPDLPRAQSAVLVKLLRANSSLAAEAKQASQSKPQNGHEAMLNFCVFARAGMPVEAKQAVLDIKRLTPELDGARVDELHEAAQHYFPSGEFKWEIVEIFADHLSYSQLLLEKLLDHRMQSGWTVERVDQWLASRPDRDGFWFSVRLQFNEKHGRGKLLVREMEASVRRHPEDMRGAINYLHATNWISVEEGETRDLEWFGELIHPKSALDAGSIAEQLETLQLPEMAAQFYQLAIATPLTEVEMDGMGSGGQQGGVVASKAEIRGRFEAVIREKLADCLQGQNQLEEAEKWIKEAAAIREQHGLEEQSARVPGLTLEQLEAALLGAEQTQAGDPVYWLKRARHSLLLRDFGKAEEACQAGLSHAPPQPRMRGKGNADIRHRLLYFYVDTLQEDNRLKDVDALLWKELTESPAMSASCEFAVSHLIQHGKQQLTIDHAVLWTWLGARSPWDDDIEGNLLEAMLSNGNPNEVEQALTRAERLAMGVDPSRALVLGSLENKMAFPRRSIPLLEYAIKTFRDKNDQVHALNVLIDSCLDMDDWQQTQRAIQQIGQLYPVDVYTDGLALPLWNSRAAVLAAKAGDKAAAMRLWRQVANLDLTATGPVAELSQAGLKDELVQFYREMQTTFPQSEVPPKVLESLH